MMMTRFGSPAPRWMATTLTISVGVGMRGPVTVSDGVTMVRQPLQARLTPSSSACAQRRAAPMPRVSDRVSDMVWRVPNPTMVSMSARIRSGRTSLPNRCSSACSCPGTVWAETPPAETSMSPVRAIDSARIGDLTNCERRGPCRAGVPWSTHGQAACNWPQTKATSPAVSNPASTGSTFSGATTRIKPMPQLKVRRSS